MFTLYPLSLKIISHTFQAIIDCCLPYTLKTISHTFQAIIDCWLPYTLCFWRPSHTHSKQSLTVFYLIPFVSEDHLTHIPSNHWLLFTLYSEDHLTHIPSNHWLLFTLYPLFLKTVSHTFQAIINCCLPYTIYFWRPSHTFQAFINCWFTLLYTPCFWRPSHTFQAIIDWCTLYFCCQDSSTSPIWSLTSYATIFLLPSNHIQDRFNYVFHLYTDS